MYRFAPNKQVIETVLSDFYKMNLTVWKMYFTKQKHETIFCRNELMKHDVSDIDFEIFHEIVILILNALTP